MKHLIPDMNLEIYEIDLDYVSDIIDTGYRSLEMAERVYNTRIAMTNSSSTSDDYSGRDSYSGGGGSSHSSGGSSSGKATGGGFR